MGTLYENIIALCNQKGIKGGKMCTDLGISKGLLTDLKMGRRTGLSAASAQKIASYFGVTVGYLLGEETEKAPVESDKRSVSDDDIKFALFGGSGEITDAMYQEVKEFAALIKLREDMKKSKE
jgi:transcriptional regulator with XRE-family HTH domain